MSTRTQTGSECGQRTEVGTVSTVDGAVTAEVTPAWPRRVAVAPIRVYQRWISPALPARCRYYPSCSAYAVQAIQVHGLAKGLVLAVWRILRCNPLTGGGVDHVPLPGRWRYELRPDQVRRPDQSGDAVG